MRFASSATVVVGSRRSCRGVERRRVSRSSYEIVVLAVRLDVLPSGTAALRHGWIALPVLTGGACSLGRRPACARDYSGRTGRGAGCWVRGAHLSVAARGRVGGHRRGHRGRGRPHDGGDRFAARGVVRRARCSEAGWRKTTSDEGLESWLAEYGHPPPRDAAVGCRAAVRAGGRAGARNQVRAAGRPRWSPVRLLIAGGAVFAATSLIGLRRRRRRPRRRPTPYSTPRATKICSV